MQTGYNADRLACTASCDGLARQHQAAIHHMGCRLRYRQRFMRTGRNALAAMVADVGVKAQATVVVLPGGTWANVDAGLATAVRSALVHTSRGMHAQGRV